MRRSKERLTSNVPLKALRISSTGVFLASMVTASGLPRTCASATAAVGAAARATPSMSAALEVRAGELQRMADAIDVDLVNLSSPRLRPILSRVCDSDQHADQLLVAAVLNPLGSAI